MIQLLKITNDYNFVWYVVRDVKNPYRCTNCSNSLKSFILDVFSMIDSYWNTDYLGIKEHPFEVLAEADSIEELLHKYSYLLL